MAHAHLDCDCRNRVFGSAAGASESVFFGVGWKKIKKIKKNFSNNKGYEGIYRQVCSGMFLVFSSQQALSVLHSWLVVI